MSKHNVVALSGREKIRDELTELIRDGAHKLIAQGLELEVSELLSALSGRRDEVGRTAVVRNGYQPARDLQTGIGPVTVKVPKIRSRDRKPVSFHSALVPPYVRKTASLGSGAAMAVSEGDCHRRDAAGAGSAAGRRSQGFIGEYGIAPEADVAAGIRELATSSFRPRSLGVYLGGRYLQWPESRSPAAVHAGDRGRQRAW